VYRIPPNGKDAFTSRLGRTESSYLYAEDGPECNDIIKTIAEELADRFKGFLLLEVWLTEKEIVNPFTVHVSQKSGLEIAKKLTDELNKINILGNPLKTDLNKGKDVAFPPYYKPLITDQDAN